MKKINNPIQFFSKNYLDNHTMLSSSSQDVKWRKLIDNNPFKENNVIAEGSISLNFKLLFMDENGNNIIRSIDTIILQNYQLKAFTLSYVDVNGSLQEFKSVINNTDQNSVIKIAQPVNARGIAMDINDPSSMAQQIGQMRVCKSIIDLKATTESEVNPVVKDGNFRTADGTPVVWTNYEKWGARIVINSIQKPQYDLLKSFIKRDDYITIIPWYEWEPKDIYECSIERGKIGTYAVNRWSGLISQTLQLGAKENAAN